MLKNLDAYPLPNGAIAANDEIPVMTRLLVQEVGHVVAAAAAGIPIDYVVIDLDEGRHATYIDVAYRLRLERDTALNGRILAAGFMAEMATFGAAELSISSDDLATLAARLGVCTTQDPEIWMKEIALRARWIYQPVLPPDAVEAIRPTYAKLVSAIESGQHVVNGAQVVPIDAFHNLSLNLPDVDYWKAHQRTKDGSGRDQILAALRGGAKSGV
ncbi:MAG: hypothetical protein NVV83_08270 [Afipia sp.]|nr:hypothetical protein [Afipia sp.]